MLLLFVAIRRRRVGSLGEMRTSPQQQRPTDNDDRQNAAIDVIQLLVVQYTHTFILSCAFGAIPMRKGSEDTLGNPLDVMQAGECPAGGIALQRSGWPFARQSC